MRLYFGKEEVTNGQTISLSKAQEDFTYECDCNKDRTYTLILLDNTINYVHYLVNNFSVELDSGDEVLSYVSPNPPKSMKKDHTYTFYIFRQSKKIEDSNLNRRSRFDLVKYAVENNLIEVDKTSFNVDPPAEKTFNTVIAFPRAKNKAKEVVPMKEGKENKYCSCLVKVVEKELGAAEKSGKTKDIKLAYNPYAICTKSAGQHERECGSKYQFSDFTLGQLQSYLTLRKIPFKLTEKREKLLERIEESKRK